STTHDWLLSAIAGLCARRIAGVFRIHNVRRQQKVRPKQFHQAKGAPGAADQVLRQLHDDRTRMREWATRDRETRSPLGAAVGARVLMSDSMCRLPVVHVASLWRRLY